MPLYFTRERPMLVRGGALIPVNRTSCTRHARRKAGHGHVPSAVARLYPLHGRNTFDGKHFEEIIEEMKQVRRSERENRSSTMTRKAPWSRRNARATSSLLRNCCVSLRREASMTESPR